MAFKVGFTLAFLVGYGRHGSSIPVLGTYLPRYLVEGVSNTRVDNTSVYSSLGTYLLSTY